MSAVKKYLSRNYRWVAGIPLVIVLAVIGVQKARHIGGGELYLMEFGGWVAYMAAMAGFAESDPERRAKRKARQAARRRAAADPDHGEPARTRRDDAPRAKRDEPARARQRAERDEPARARQRAERDGPARAGRAETPLPRRGEAAQSRRDGASAADRETAPRPRRSQGERSARAAHEEPARTRREEPARARKRPSPRD